MKELHEKNERHNMHRKECQAGELYITQGSKQFHDYLIYEITRGN